MAVLFKNSENGRDVSASGAVNELLVDVCFLIAILYHEMSAGNKEQADIFRKFIETELVRGTSVNYQMFDKYNTDDPQALVDVIESAPSLDVLF